MKVKIQETGQIVDLVYRAPDTGIECTADIIGINGNPDFLDCYTAETQCNHEALEVEAAAEGRLPGKSTPGCYACEGTWEYLVSQDTYDWWLRYINATLEMDAAMAAAEETHGRDAVQDCLSTIRHNADWEDVPALVMQALEVLDAQHN